MIGKFKKITGIIVLVITGILLSKCQSDDINSVTNDSVNSAKEWFNNSPQNLDAIKYTKKINWEKAIVTPGETNKTIEVPLSLDPNTTTNVINDTDFKTYMSLLFVEDNVNGILSVSTIVYTTKDPDYAEKRKIFNLYKLDPKYAGYITIQNSSNKIVYSGEYEDGKHLTYHNYYSKQYPESRYVCAYYVTVVTYQTCSAWTWIPDDSSGPVVPPFPGGPPPVTQPVRLPSEWENVLLSIPQESNIIPNRSEYFKCFKPTEGGMLHVYVDQPVANSTQTYTGNITSEINVGHTFVALEQKGLVRVVGFYPATGVNPISPRAPSAYVNDSGHSYDVRITKTLNAASFNNVLNAIKNFSASYNLNSLNCSDFAQQIARTGGLNLPNTNGSWPGGEGTNPGNLGQDIRNMDLPSDTTRKTTGGQALSNTTCN